MREIEQPTTLHLSARYGGVNAAKSQLAIRLGRRTALKVTANSFDLEQFAAATGLAAEAFDVAAVLEQLTEIAKLLIERPIAAQRPLCRHLEDLIFGISGIIEVLDYNGPAAVCHQRLQSLQLVIPACQYFRSFKHYQRVSTEGHRICQCFEQAGVPAHAWAAGLMSEALQNAFLQKTTLDFLNELAEQPRPAQYFRAFEDPIVQAAVINQLVDSVTRFRKLIKQRQADQRQTRRRM